MDNIKKVKQINIESDQIEVTDGKVVISNDEYAKAFEDQEFDIENEGSDCVVPIAVPVPVIKKT